MRLPASEVERFYRLYFAVLCYANQQLGLARQVTTIPQIMAMPQEDQYALRQGVYAHREVIATFVQANPARFADEDLTIVEGVSDMLICLPVGEDERNTAKVTLCL